MLHTIICAILAVAPIHADNMSVMNGDVIHIVFDTPEEQENRGPAIFPVSGYVDQFAGYAVLSFSSPCGQVHVQLQNLDDGTCVSSFVIGTGSAMIPFSCSSGTWKMTVALSNGADCVGWFVLS